MSKDYDKPKDKILKFEFKPNPLSKAERRECERTLYQWKDRIDRGEIEEADKLMPRRPKYVSNPAEAGLWYLFCLFQARYFRAVGDNESFNNSMAFLDLVAPEFDNEYNFYYYRLIGSRELAARRYKAALEALYKAEEVGSPEWHDVGYAYMFGCCLSDMGFVERAIYFFDKALNLANESDNHLYDVYIQCSLAYDYCKAGKGDGALGLLKGCSFIENYRDYDDASKGYLYLTYGFVYHHMKRYDEALENYETAFQYYTEYCESYVRLVYRKASTLIASGRIDEGLALINRGFSLFENEVEWSAIWEVLYNALKHSALLSIPESVERLKNNDIPKLLDFGQYDEAINCTRQIKEFYKNAGDTDRVVEYSELANKIYEKYINDRMKGVTT